MGLPMETVPPPQSSPPPGKFVYLASSSVAVHTRRDAEKHDDDDEDNRPTKRLKTLVKIGVATRPYVRVYCQHNRKEGFTEGSKDTKNGAPNWRLRLVLGPFDNGTHKILDEWKSRSRGFRARVQRGLVIGLREQTRLCRPTVWLDSEEDET